MAQENELKEQDLKPITPNQEITAETSVAQTTEKPKDALSYAPTVMTIFFFFVFCYIIYAVFKKGTNKKFDKYSQIPLDDDKPKQ